MAGIQIGSSFQLTSPQPHLANASFPDAPSRLAQGQLRHVSWRYSQDSPDAHYRIKPLALCFLADNVTPAVQFDSWGTLEAHWRIIPVTSDDLPESATPTNKYYTSGRAALKADLVNGIVPATQLPPLYNAITSAADGPVTPGAVSAALLQLQAPIVLIKPDGTTSYFTTWPTSDLTPPGSQIRIRGSFTIPGDLNSFNASLVLEAGAVLTFNRLTIGSYGTDNDNRVTVSGPGTLRGNINLYYTTAGLPAAKVQFMNLRHEGIFFNDIGLNTLGADVRWTNVACVPPAGYAYLATFSRNSTGGGCFYFRYRFYQCRFTISGISPVGTTYVIYPANQVAAAFQLGSFNYPGPTATDATDKANSILEAVGCTFVGDGTSNNKVLATSGGFATYRFAYNTAFGITAPTDANDTGFSLWPAGSSAAAPAPAAPTTSAATFTAS